MSDEVEVKVTVEDMRAVRLEMYDPKGATLTEEHAKSVVFFGLINVPLIVDGKQTTGNIWYKPTDFGLEAIVDNYSYEDLNGALAGWDAHKAAGTLLTPENAELLSSLEVGDHGVVQ